jgi:hypothetical protein
VSDENDKYIVYGTGVGHLLFAMISAETALSLCSSSSTISSTSWLSSPATFVPADCVSCVSQGLTFKMTEQRIHACSTHDLARPEAFLIRLHRRLRLVYHLVVAASQSGGLTRSTPLAGIVLAGVGGERPEELAASVVDVCLGDTAEVGSSGKVEVCAGGVPDINSHISVWKKSRGSEDVLAGLAH